MDISGYGYHNSDASHADTYLLPAVFDALQQGVRRGLRKRIFELGCGNGSVANKLATSGFKIVGVDPSPEGVFQANKNFPNLNITVGSSETDLASKFGRFPFVLSLEVIEHVFAPRQFAARVFDLLEPGGLAIISTPYHGYIKNLALALSGKLDAHFTALWDYGHIKFWSIKTLSELLSGAGFGDISFKRVGRIPPLAKSMVATATSPPRGPAAGELRIERASLGNPLRTLV